MQFIEVPSTAYFSRVEHLILKNTLQKQKKKKDDGKGEALP